MNNIETLVNLINLMGDSIKLISLFCKKNLFFLIICISFLFFMSIDDIVNSIYLDILKKQSIYSMLSIGTLFIAITFCVTIAITLIFQFIFKLFADKFLLNSDIFDFNYKDYYVIFPYYILSITFFYNKTKSYILPEVMILCITISILANYTSYTEIKLILQNVPCVLFGVIGIFVTLLILLYIFEKIHIVKIKNDF